MYKISHFVWLSLWSFLAYKLMGLFFRGKKVEVPDPEPTYAATGNEEVDELIQQGQTALRQMRRLNDQIQDKKLSQQIARLEQLSSDIFHQVVKNPEKAGRIRKFMNYYLPTTIKLLDTYAELSAQSVRGKNIKATMERIDAMMDTIVAAFEKQLDGLFSAEALDISTDITVLEGMLQREGLAGQSLTK